MVVCPIALAVGCRKCPVFGVCPLKSVIGDYKPEATPEAKPAEKAAAPSNRGAPARKSGSNRKGARARRPRK